MVNYEYAYQVSNLGRIKRKERRSKTYNTNSKRSHTVSEMIRKPSIKNGYPFCWLYSKDGSRKMQYVHRLVSECFLENPNNYNYIDHIDRNRKNNNINNLRWCTQSTNLRNRANVKGYCYSKKNKRYYSSIKINGKKKALVVTQPRKKQEMHIRKH